MKNLKLFFWKLSVFSTLLCSFSHVLWAENYADKARKLELQSQWTEARRAWQFELIEHPKNLNARYSLARILEKSGHTNDAFLLYKKNIAIGGSLNSVLALTQLYMQKHQRLAAITTLKKATKDFRYEAVPWYLLAVLAMQDKKIKQAQHYFQSALKADPLNGFAHLRYAYFLSTQKQYKQAIQHAQKALRLQKNCAPCWEIYGTILKAATNKQGALQAYQRSLAIQPSPTTRQQLIDLLKQLGQQQRAERMQQALNTLKKNMR